MNKWVELTSEMKQFLGFPVDITGANKYRVFGVRNSISIHEEPYPYVAFWNAPSNKKDVKILIGTTSSETSLVGYNPLERTEPSYLEMNQSLVKSLIHLVEQERGYLNPNLLQEQLTVVELDKSEAGKLGMHPEWFPRGKRRYIQLIRNSLPHWVELIVFSIEQNQSIMSMEFFSFHIKNLTRSNYSPLDEAESTITLNSVGLQAFSALLTEQASAMT